MHLKMWILSWILSPADHLQHTIERFLRWRKPDNRRNTKPRLYDTEFNHMRSKFRSLAKFFMCFVLCGSSLRQQRSSDTAQHPYNGNDRRQTAKQQIKQTNKTSEQSECAQIPLALDRINCYGLKVKRYALTQMAHSFRFAHKCDECTAGYDRMRVVRLLYPFYGQAILDRLLCVRRR